jgi:hypothetical protein
MFTGSSQPPEHDSLFVMAGLRPCHPRLLQLEFRKNVDTRDKPGMTNSFKGPILLTAF